jgi:predicted DNA binding CopG/RHH family protein
MAEKSKYQQEIHDDQKELNETLSEFFAGNLKRIPITTKERKELQQAAAVALKKDNRINIRLSTQDLERIKEKAAAAGIPYQTLIGAILHQYASDRISASI